MPCPFSESATFCWKKLGLRQLALEQFLRSAVIRSSSFSELPGAQLDYRSQSNWRFPRRRAVISNDSAVVIYQFSKTTRQATFLKTHSQSNEWRAPHSFAYFSNSFWLCPVISQSQLASAFESSRCPQEAWNNFTGFISCRNFQSKLPSRRLP